MRHSAWYHEPEHKGDDILVRAKATLAGMRHGMSTLLLSKLQGDNEHDRAADKQHKPVNHHMYAQCGIAELHFYAQVRQ